MCDVEALEARFFGADVVRNGLTAHCQLGLSSVTGGASDVTFSTTTPLGASTSVTSFVGEVLDATGHYAPPGTRIEAFAGNVRCGVTAISRTGSFSGYTLVTAGPDAVLGCTTGSTLSFRVDGKPAMQTSTNDIGQQRSPFDLTVA